MHLFFNDCSTLFQKFWELAKQVSEFMTWKKVECPFEKDRKILQYLLTAPAYTEDGMLKDGGAMCKEKSQFWGV